MELLKQYPIPATLAIFALISVIGYYGTEVAMGGVTETGKVIGVWLIVAGIAARLIYNSLVPVAPKAAGGD
ncbi:MAG: hypothetical protein EXQ96_09855 [Alphaproteobacteria bacterium]|nr:hypothetical protein [Alphaproteobacteria bacterium]